MASADVLEFHDISSEVKGALCRGRLKLNDQNIIFKNSKTGKVDQISADDIDHANWHKLAGQYAIRLFLKNGTLHRLIGFKDSEREKVAKFFTINYRIDVLEKELSLKGWNWGTAKFMGSVLSFEVNNHTAFEIPLNNVSHSTTAKNEVTLEFHQNDEAPVSLIEMRFHIPSSELAGDDPVDAFHQQVMKQADVINVSGDAIAIFREIHILTPRGRYDIKIFSQFFQLHGKTFDYKVPMSTVVRLFLLPHKDGRQYFLVISLDPPIKQGQTRYHYLVLLFNQDETVSMDLPWDEETIKTKYDGKITKELSGPTYEVLAKIMKVLVKTKITTPGSFIGHSGTAAISCSFKAAAGYIYPLDRGFIYIHKPPIHIRFEEILCVNFAREGGTNRSFDFELELKNGTVYTFSSIEKEEYGKLYSFIDSKKLRIKNCGNTDAKYTADDFGDSDQETAPDAYLEQVKREGKQKDEDDDDDDESTDEDYQIPVGNDSEVDEEYDSNAASSSSDSGAGSGAEKEKKEHKKKKEKKSEKHKKSKDTVSKPKKKKEKDANRPKRPPTAYMLWFNETREQIKTDHPGISFTEIGKKGGELWKKLSSSDKEPFESRANAAKEEYAKAMKEYEATGRASNQNTSTSSSKKSSASKTSSVSSSKPGSGRNYVSKEFVESDSSSSNSDDGKAKKKKKKSKAEESSNEDSDKDTTSKKREVSESSSDEKRKPQSKKKKEESDSEAEDSSSDMSE